MSDLAAKAHEIEEGYREEYFKLKDSGMFWEFFPEYTGDWQQDGDKFRAFKHKQSEAVKPNETWQEYRDRTHDAIKPNYYRRTIKGVEIDAIDIIQAWGLSFLLGNVLKYILRAGQKENNSREQDLRKAQENINRELEGIR